MLLPKSFLGSPSDQHLCFLWIIIHKKQHRTDNKNTSNGNTANSLCLISRNSPTLTQIPNGGSQSMTPRQEAWCYTPQPAVTGLAGTGLARWPSPWLIPMGENNPPRAEEIKKACRTLEPESCIRPVPPCTGDTSQCYFPLVNYFLSPSSVKHIPSSSQLCKDFWCVAGTVRKVGLKFLSEYKSRKKNTSKRLKRHLAY